MTYLLKRGNPEFLAGEFFVYAHCSDQDEICFPGLFFSSDRERLLPLREDEDDCVEECAEDIAVVMPKMCMSEEEVMQVNTKNIVRVLSAKHCKEGGVFSDLEHAMKTCRTVGLQVMREYYAQLDQQYGINIPQSLSGFQECEAYCNQLDVLVNKLLDAYAGEPGGLNDDHAGEAAASLLRRMSDDCEVCYADMKNLIEVASLKTRVSRRIRSWVVLSNKETLKGRKRKENGYEESDDSFGQSESDEDTSVQ